MNKTYKAIKTHEADTAQCSLVPITAALLRTPNTPFRSENRTSFSLGIRFRYAHVQMTSRPNTTSPSKEYTFVISPFSFLDFLRPQVGGVASLSFSAHEVRFKHHWGWRGSIKHGVERQREAGISSRSENVIGIFTASIHNFFNSREYPDVVPFSSYFQQKVNDCLLSIIFFRTTNLRLLINGMETL